MSYILDALKKSDRERQRGKVPSLNSIHDPSLATPLNRSSGKRTKSVFMAAGLILLVCISAITWYWSKNSRNTDLQILQEETRITITEPELNRPSVSKTEPLKENNISPPPSPVITARSKKLTVLTDKANPSEEKGDIPGLEDLSGSTRAAIPDLHLAGHTYSENPTKRMIIINDTILREGDRLDETIKLVEITWTGVILDYNGEQFTVDIE